MEISPQLVMKGKTGYNMIQINSPNHEYEYDLHSLVKAFFPKEEITFIKDGEEPKDQTNLVSLMIDEKNHCAQLILSFFNAHADSPDTKEMRSYTMDESYVNQIAGFKNQVKLFFYDSMVDFSKRELPWGNLTGIRPTKIALSYLEAGKSEEEICEILEREHRVGDEKKKLGIEIAKRERNILSPLDYDNGYSLYIGIPFCPTTCLYCSFTSNPIGKWQKRIDEYLDCLQRELEYCAEEFKDKKCNTIYIGGGTPTALSKQHLERLLKTVTEIFSFEHLYEFTVESGRPDSITEEKLLVMKKYNVSRISVNPQTMNQETLKYIGRQHSVKETIDTFHLARNCGFDNINMDIILGLPQEKPEHVRKTLDEISKLRPDSLTVHSLAIKRASKMRSFVEENGMEIFGDPEEMMQIASEGARSLGMVPYYLYRQKNMAGNLENVGYAKEGKYGIYNILIMEEVQNIVACGAGVVSKRVYQDGRIERCDNVKDVALYIDKIDEMKERKKALFRDWK